MILVSFFSEDNVLSDEIKICYIFEYQSNKIERSAFFGTLGIVLLSKERLKKRTWEGCPQSCIQHYVAFQCAQHFALFPFQIDWPHPQPYWPRGPNFWPVHWGTFQIDPTHNLTGHEAQTSDQSTGHFSYWPHPQPYLATRPKLLTSPPGTFQIDPTHNLTGHEVQTSDQPTRHFSDWPHPQPYLATRPKLLTSPPGTFQIDPTHNLTWPRGPNFWPAHQALFRLTPPTTLPGHEAQTSDQPTRHFSDWPHPQPYWPRGPNFWPAHRAIFRLTPPTTLPGHEAQTIWPAHQALFRLTPLTTLPGHEAQTFWPAHQALFRLTPPTTLPGHEAQTFDQSTGPWPMCPWLEREWNSAKYHGHTFMFNLIKLSHIKSLARKFTRNGMGRGYLW